MNELELIKGRANQALEIVDKEIFMRNLVFKNKLKVRKKKVEEMEFVKETITGLVEILEGKEE